MERWLQAGGAGPVREECPSVDCPSGNRRGVLGGEAHSILGLQVKCKMCTPPSKVNGQRSTVNGPHPGCPWQRQFPALAGGRCSGAARWHCTPGPGSRGLWRRCCDPPGSPPAPPWSCAPSPPAWVPRLQPQRWSSSWLWARRLQALEGGAFPERRGSGCDRQPLC